MKFVTKTILDKIAKYLLRNVKKLNKTIVKIV